MASISQERPLPMASSDSKSKFYKRLGMEESDKGHRRLYNMMKDEAAEGRGRLITDPENFAPAVRNAQSMDPSRVKFADITEEAMQREGARIYRDAQAATRIIYDLAHDPESKDDNWIIRWFVWHVFRYRDERNGSRHRKLAGISSDDEMADPGTDEDALLAARGLQAEQSLSESPSSNDFASSDFYDPVRDRWQSQQQRGMDG